jgi:hypothetical protein
MGVGYLRIPDCFAGKWNDRLHVSVRTISLLQYTGDLSSLQAFSICFQAFQYAIGYFLLIGE